MIRSRLSGLFMGVSLLCVMPMRAQEPRPASDRADAPARRTQPAEPESPAAAAVPGQGNQAAAPRLVKVNGALTEFVRNPVGSSVEMTFAVYKDEVGGEALWTETQSVEVDKEGRYTVLLGAAQADGVPVELFPAGEPRWLGVDIRGQAPQPRTLLVSVPYALKALDAEKLSGKSLSDFVLSESLGDQVRRVVEGQNIVASQATSTGTAQPGQTRTNSTSAAATGAAGPMFPPSSFSGTNSTQIVRVDQNGSGNGLYAQTASGTGNSGIVGVATSTSISNNQNGVIGFNAGAGSGVAGIATNPSSGVGVYGQGANFAGVFGQTFNPNTNGVAGSANATTGFSIGVSGFSASTNGAGVFGNAGATSGFANGVQGQTSSPNGEGVGGFGIATGVFGTASATSGFANGVFGQSFSPNGTGVNGFANATSGFALGVSGGTVSSDGAGVFGNAIATSGFANGVQGQTSSPFGAGVFGIAAPNGQSTGVYGQTVNWVGVGGQALATSGSPAYGVWGDSVSTDGSGVAGYADAGSGPTNGVYGHSVSPNGSGVQGVNDSSAANFNNGVLGINNATTGNAYGVNGATQTTGFGAGVAGQAFATTGNAFGVFGQTNSPSGTAMFANAFSGSGFPTAVVGFLNSPQGGVAGQFVAHTGAGLILQGLSGPNFNQVFSVDANGNLNISGNLVVSGTKSSTARLQSGREVALYAVESPENWFEDFGSAELKGGAAWVPLDASFAEATNAAVTYHVFLTPDGDSNGLYVARKTATGFEVREHGGGDSNVAFDYRIVVRRRGYEAVRMAEVQHDVKTADASRQHLAEFVSSGVPKKAAAVRVPQIVAPPAIRPVPQRPNPNVQQSPKSIIPQMPKVNVAQPAQPK